MKLPKKIVAIILVILMVGLYGCNEKKPENTESSDNTEWINLIENGTSEYVIIVPKGDSDLFAKAYALASSIQSVTGVRLQVLQDTYPEQEKELLIGMTSRTVNAGALSAMKTPDDYAVVRSSDKILISGSTGNAIDSAIAYFTENYVNTVSDGVLRVPADMEYIFLSSAQYITIAENGKSEYVIVSRDADREYAEMVQNAIKDLTGVTLRIASSSESAQDKEIIIGDGQRTEGLKIEKGITTAFEGVFEIVGSKLIIAGGSDVALEASAEYFAENVKRLMFNGKLMISGNYSEHVNFGEEIAKDVLESINFNSVKFNFSADAEEIPVYVPDGSDDAWYYTHHPFMTKFNGTYYIFYSSGRRNEDDCGQRIMMATSTDFYNWNISVLVDSIQGKYAEWVLYCKGLYVYNGVLTVYYCGYEYAQDELRQNSDGTPLRPKDDGNISRIPYGTFYIQTTDGRTWSEAKSLDSINGGNMSPIEYEGDVLLWAGYGSLSSSDSLTGTEKWTNIRLVLNPDTPAPKSITESSIYQLSDGTLIIMSRTDGGFSLAAASFDGGKSWTDMYETDFTDFAAKFQFGTLPDGRYYYVGNLSSSRMELVVMISENGIDFTECYYIGDSIYQAQKTGMYKAGNYGYPTTYIDDEYMYIVYSKGKEALGVTRVKLSSLGVK